MGWIIDSIIGHNINFLKYYLLAGSCYIKLPKDLDNPKKRFDNIQNIVNVCFKLCLVRYLHPADHHPVGIRKTEIFVNIKFPVKLKIFTNKKKGIELELKQKLPIYESKAPNLCQKTDLWYVDLLLIGEKGKRHYVLIKDFSTFIMIIHYTAEENKHFCHYYLQAFSTKEILKWRMNDSRFWKYFILLNDELWYLCWWWS